jgi:hypothetical protein
VRLALVRRAGALDRDEMRSPNNDGIDQALLVWMTLIAVTVALLLYTSAAIPAFVWCAARGQIAVLPFVDAVGGMARWIVGGLHHDPRTVPGLLQHREVLPPPPVWLALDAVLASTSLATLLVAWLRIDRWRSLERIGLPAWDPR